MGLKDGTLHSLIDTGTRPEQIADRVLSQILRALDYLAVKDIIHRDVKSENIFFVRDANGDHQFQLGDCGLCNRALNAVTYSGTPKYMAPEVCQGAPQSCKADVWSLFVSVMWTLDVHGFRQAHFRTMEAIQTAIRVALSDKIMSRIREIVILDPHQRASAAQMLVKLYKGQGLSTPLRQIPELTPAPLQGHTTTALPAHDRPNVIKPKQVAPRTNPWRNTRPAVINGRVCRRRIAEPLRSPHVLTGNVHHHALPPRTRVAG